jgi:hypothetical protein
MTAKPDGSEWWEVAELEPERFLCLRMSVDLRGRPFDPARPRPRLFPDSTWGFQLEELPGGRTRLVVSGYWSLRPRWLRPLISAVFLEPSHWIMQTRQFANIKRRAERDAAAADQLPAGSSMLGSLTSLRRVVSELLRRLTAHSAPSRLSRIAAARWRFGIA